MFFVFLGFICLIVDLFVDLCLLFWQKFVGVKIFFGSFPPSVFFYNYVQRNL